MTTDRELLELAAKAAGIEFIPERSSDDMLWLVSGVVWSPKHDDGDALRLAVKIGITEGRCMQIVIDGEMKWTGTRHTERGGKYDADARHESDPYTATRRAIVRAAAEIGRNMK